MRTGDLGEKFGFKSGSEGNLKLAVLTHFWNDVEPFVIKVFFFIKKNKPFIHFNRDTCNNLKNTQKKITKMKMIKIK